MADEKNKGGFWGGLGYFGQSLLAGLGNIAEGAFDAALAPLADLTGNHEFAESLFKNNWVGDWYSDVTEDFNPGTGWEFAGNVAHGLGQSAYLFIPYAGAPIFFSGVMAQGISSAAQQTGDVGIKEAAYGLTTGAVEGALEYVGGAAAKGAKTLFKSGAKSAVKSTVRKGLVKQVLSDAASEFTEEAMSEVIDVGLQRLYGINPNAELSLKDVLYAGAVGAVSGAVTTTAVQVPINIKNRARGEKIIKDGNSQTLVNTATSIADRIAAQGTDWDKAPEWAAAIRGQVDAYEKLSAGEKTGIRGQTLLGEMQSSLFFAEHQSVFNEVQKNIQNADEQSRATWAEYINKSVSKERRNNRDFTAEDVKNNTDNVAWQLAVYRYVPAMFNLDAAVVDLDTAQESGIADVVARNQGAESGAVAGAEPVAVGAEQYDLVGKDVNGNEIYETSEETKKLPRKQRMRKFVDIMNNEYYGRTAKFTVDGETYYARFDQKDVNKNVYGDRRSDRKGYNAKIDVGADGNIFELVENAKYQDSRAESGKSTDAHKNVSEWDYFDKTVIIDGTQYDVLINIRKKDNGEYVYSVQLRESKKEASSSSRAHYDNSHSSNKEDDASSGGRTPPASANTLAGTSKTSGRSSTDNSIHQNESVVNPEAKEISSDDATDEKGKNLRSDAINAEGEQTGAETVQGETAGASPRPTGEFDGEADLDRAKRDAERMIEWEKKNAPTAEELNTVRDYVKGFDSLPADRQLAIVRMIRSSEGVDADTVRGVANLMAITNRKGEALAPDLEFRFAELADGVAKRGIKTEVGGKTVIVLNTNSTYKNTIRGSIAHEIVHYLENRKGYKALAEYAMKHAKAEKVAQVRETYKGVYKGENAEAKIEAEVVASVVAEMLGSEKFLKRYAQMGEEQGSVVKRIAKFVKGIANALKEKDDKASAVAADMMKLVDRALGSEIEGEKTGEKFAVNTASKYDFKKSFSEQVEDYKNGVFPTNDALLIGSTPQIYKNIGFNALPMTINQTHVDYALNGTKNADHSLGEALLKQLPQALKVPIAVIASKTQNTTSVVAILSIKHNGNQVTVPVFIDGISKQNGIRIDSNAVTSVYSRKNAISSLMIDALADEANGKVAVYYWDKKRAVALLPGGKVTMPNVLNTLSDGYMHSIREKGSPVKPKFENVTESQQFKRWFGDWEKHPNTASKVVNADGTPKILYHQTADDFTVFDPRHKGAGTNDDETPFGIFMKPADNDIGLKGKKQMALYARIVNPLKVQNRYELVEKLKSMSSKYANLLAERNRLNEEYKKKVDDAGEAWQKYAREYRAAHPDITRSELSKDAEFARLFDLEDFLVEEWVEKANEISLRMKDEITQTLKDNKYDGVILKEDAGSGGRTVETYIALEPTQVKSATDNIGTFEKSEPDIRYDLDPEAVKEQKKKTTTKAEPKGIKTGSAEAGRFAVGLRKEFGLNKAAEETIRSKLETLEEVFIKGDREAYIEEYRKKVEEIFDIVSREATFEVTTDKVYERFQTYMRGKRFRVDKQFRQSMGREEWNGVYSVIRGRLASDKNTAAPHVDSLYAELNDLFPDLFSSEIINVHDQLERIAKVMLDAKNAQSEEFDFSQLPDEWKGSVAIDVVDRINSFITRVSSNRDSLKIIKAEKNELLKMLKKERSMREKMAREEANAAKAERARIFTKKAVAPAVEEIEGLTDEQVRSLAKGFALEGMSGAQKDRIISDIYIALHEASAEGEAGPGSVAVKVIATRIAWDMVQSAKIRGDDGKLYHLIDIYNEASVQAIASEYANVLYERFANMGEHTKYSYFVADIRAAEEEFRRDKIDDNAIHKLSREVSYQGQQLRRLVETQKRGMEDEGIQKVTKILASVVDAKGNIVTSKVDEAIGEADRFYSLQSGMTERQEQTQEGDSLTEFAYSSDANLKFMIDEFKQLRAQVDKRGKDRTGKFLDAQEMRLLGKILAGMRKTVTEYNKVFINERYVDIDKVASDGATDIVEYHSLDKKAKTKVGELFDTLMRGIKQSYFYNVLTPETTIEALEGFKIGGVLKTLYHDVRVHKQKAEHLAVQMKKPFADYLDSKENVWTDTDGKKHSFRDKLNKKMINYNGAELTLGEAIYLYMLTKRELSHAGLRENGYIVYDENNQHRLEVEIEDVEAARGEISSKLDDADKAFLKMAEDFFNKTSTEVKNEADMRIFGYTNIEDGYYVPMIRDRYSRMQGVTDQRQSVGSIITVYNKSFNQNTVQNAKALEGKNIMSIINDHADGLADYSELYIPLKSFDRVYNKAVMVDGKTRSIREILNNEVWNKTGSYLRDLFADIQGQNRKSDNVIDSMVGKLRSAWVNSVLGLNLKVVATQTTSFVAANQVIEAKYLMPAMKKFFGNQSELGARADKYSDIIEPRSFEMGALRAQGNIDKVMEWSSKTGFMINLMDRRVCLAVFHAAELKAQAQGAGAVGTVENAKAAAKIADEAIYTTQAMTSASERSALQRSKSEIARTLSMFTSDSVKNLSHFVGNIMKYQAHKARAKSDLASKAQYEAELKKDARAIRRSAKTLVMTGVMLGLITQAFKYLYAKEEKEPEEKAKDLATDVISSTFNILPGVSDIIDKFVFDYDLSLNVFDVANYTIEDTASLMNMAGRAMAGEYVSGDKVFKNVFNFVKTVGAAFGAPIAPVERTVTGLLRRFFPSAIYGYDAMMSNPSYSADLKAAVENGDDALAEHILETIYKNEATGVYSTPELEEVSALYQKGYTSVIPQKIGATVNDVTLDRKQRAKFEKIYGKASAKVNELIRSDYYAELDDEQRAKAIKTLYSLYYNRAAAEVAGVEWSNAQAYSRLTDNYSALFAAQAYKSGLTEYKNLRGKVVSVKDQFVKYVENLGLNEVDKLVVLYANGYRDAKTKKKMLAYINALSISEDEKAKIAERLGFAVENGKVVEKKEELEVRAE